MSSSSTVPQADVISESSSTMASGSHIGDVAATQLQQLNGG